MSAALAIFSLLSSTKRSKIYTCRQAIHFINEVGFPIAAALGLGFFIWKLINRIIDGLEVKIDVLDDKVNEALKAMEGRIQAKLESQHGILIALIDRVRSVDNEIIRQDTLLKTLLGAPNLINTDKIAKAERDDQRKD